MLDRPAFLPHFRVQPVDVDTVLLAHATEQHALHGRLYRELAPHLDGTNTARAIADRLTTNGRSRAEVYYGILRLQKRGVLYDAATNADAAQAAFWAAAGLGPTPDQPSVRVRVLGHLVQGDVVSALEQAGLRSSRDGLLVVVTDDYLNPALEEINARALAESEPWVLVRPNEPVWWMGPLFKPGETGCWTCLAERLRGNQQVESFIQFEAATYLAPPPVRQAALSEAALTLAALQISRHHAGYATPLEGSVVSVDLATMDRVAHPLQRLPHCRACGTPTSTGLPVASLELQSRAKRFTADGGHRSATPAETIERYSHLISPITGIVPELIRADDVPSPLHVYRSGPNFAAVQWGYKNLRLALRSQAAGKGRSDEQARASALCEALERQSGRYRGDEPRMRARQADLGDAAVPLDRLQHFSEQQYANRERHNRIGDHFQYVPVPFDPDREIDWSPAWSLTENRWKFVPTAYCWFQFEGFEVAFTRADSNGCASGNNREEAILQGFLELVERDAIALWWYNRIPRPAVDIDAFDDSYYDRVRAYVEQIGCEMWALDITSDFGVPVFVACSRRKDGKYDDIQLGYGAHFDARIALLRAITELNQSLAFQKHLPSFRDPTFHVAQDSLSRWRREVTRENQPFIAPKPGEAATTPSMYPHTVRTDMLDDIRACEQMVRDKGMEMLVLDQTRADVGLPVMRVMVPGLRHFWRRLGPGRLYDVPVEMGWLDAPLAEDDMSPYSMFF